MRVTNSMLVSNLRKNLNYSMTRMDKLQNQMATGRKYSHISDDPAALIYGMSARNKMARLDNYKSTVSTAQDWLLQAEVGIMELQSTLVNAYELTIDAASDTKGTIPESGSDKPNIAQVVAQLRDHYVDTLNTTFGDKFVFSGYNTPGDPTIDPGTGAYLDPTIRAFTVQGDPPQLYFNGFNLSQFDGMSYAEFTAEPPAGPMAAQIEQLRSLQADVLTFDVGTGVEMQVTMNGIDLLMFATPDTDPGGTGEMLIRNSWNVLQELYERTAAGEPAANISRMIAPLQGAQNHLLGKTAEIGGRVRRLELLEARYESDAINYERMRSDAEDADMAEVIMYFKMAEAVHQAALSAGARVIQPTLMDFLR